MKRELGESQRIYGQRKADEIISQSQDTNIQNAKNDITKIINTILEIKAEKDTKKILSKNMMVS